MTSQEVTVALQRHREVYCKVQLMSYDYSILEELNGVVLSTPSFSIDSSSDLRRSCSFSLTPTDSSFDFAENSKIWMDKYIKVFMGIKDQRTDEIVYTNMGMYLVNNPSRVYNATDNTITVQGLDLMARLNGNRGGNMTGIAITIPKGSNVKSAIERLLTQYGFTEFVVEECDINSQDPSLYGNTYTDIEISAGQTVYNALTQLRDVVPNYQMYFDVDGVFHYEKIPTGENEPIMVDDEIWSQVMIEYTDSVSYEDVYNCVEVYGKTQDTDYYATIEKVETASDKSKSVYYLNIPSLTDSYNLESKVTETVETYTDAINKVIGGISGKVTVQGTIEEARQKLVAILSGDAQVKKINSYYNKIVDPVKSIETTIVGFVSETVTAILRNPTYRFLTVSQLKTFITQCTSTAEGSYMAKIDYAVKDQSQVESANLLDYALGQATEETEGDIEEYAGAMEFTDADKSNLEAILSTLSDALEAVIDELIEYTSIWFTPTENASGTKYFRVNYGIAYPLYSNINNKTVPTFELSPTHNYVADYRCGEDYFTLTRVDGAKKVADTVTVYDNNLYTLGYTSRTAESISDGEKFYFKAPNYGNDSSYYPQFQINDSDYYSTKDSSGNDYVSAIMSGKYYCLTFHLNSENESKKCWYFYGDGSPTATVVASSKKADTEYPNRMYPTSPFTIEKVGIQRVVLSGGDYDNYYTNEDCLSVAKKELYDRCAMLNSITIECVPLYWLDVNWVVELTLPKKYSTSTEETKKYIIKSISINNGYNATQSITLMEYQPEYIGEDD